jgi:glycosyltransferase involved in cell wall biosynthesis
MVIGIDASRAVTGRRTGTEAYAYFLIRALIPPAGEAGHTLRLYFNQKPAVDLFPKASHVEHKVLAFPRLWTHLRLGRELRRHPPDVFFTPAHVIPAGYHQPAVATVHDLGYLSFPEAHTRRQVAYLRWSTRHNVRHSRPVITDSAATRDDLIRLWDVKPERIKVIYPGIDPALRPIRDTGQLMAVQNKFGIRPPYLLHIGTIQPRKNLARLIDAFAASGLTHQLVLAGGMGWRSESILRRIDEQEPGVRERIILPGYFDEDNKGALISGADALVYPSLYEGFGFPLVEANVCGTPVLGADTSSLPEIAGGSAGEAGQMAALLVDPLDTEALRQGLLQVAGDEALRKRLVAAGLVNSRRFSWQQTAREVLEALVGE